MQSKLFQWVLAAGVVLSAPAMAFDGVPKMVNIDAKFIEVTTNLTQQLGVQWGVDAPYGGLFRGGQPTGEPALDFDVPLVGAGGGASLVARLPRGETTILSRPTIVTLFGGAEASLFSGSDSILRIPGIGGAVRDLVRVDGGPGFNLAGAENASFSIRQRAHQLSAGAGVTTQVSPNAQVFAGLEAIYMGTQERSLFSVQNGGQTNEITSELDTHGFGFNLQVTPIITVGDNIVLNLSVSGGPVFVDSEMDVRQRVNNLDIRVRESRSTVIVQGEVGGSIVLGGLLNDRANIEIGGRATFLQDVPFVGHAFRNGSPSSIGRGDRTNLLIFVNARILLSPQ